jgi:hypothetical protein
MVEELAEQYNSVKALLSTCFYAGILISLFFYPENVGDMFLRKVSRLSTDCMALYLRR